MILLFGAALFLAAPPTPSATPAPPATPEREWKVGRDPALFPADVPGYPTAEDELFSIAEPSYDGSFHTVDPPEKVTAFYWDRLTRAGWKGQRSGGEHAFLVLTKADRTVRVDAAPNDVDHDTEVFVHIFVQPPPTPTPAATGTKGKP